MKETSSPRSMAPDRDRLNVLLFFMALVLCSTALASASGYESTNSIRVGVGWNLISLPASVGNESTDTLFPSAVSHAYIFQSLTGYQAPGTLQNGVGFWLKFDSSATLHITGSTILEDTVEVQAGWNIVGSLSKPIAVSAIQADPPGNITSQWFGYRPGAGYQLADTLYPGFGYWVRVIQAGSIVLSSGPASCPGMPTVDYAGKTYNTVQIGSQCWLRENLDVGTMIDGSGEQTNNNTIEKYCTDNDLANCNTYGGLYQWNEAMQYTTRPGARGICPLRWHIPTLREIQTLSATVGGDGNALKAIGQGSGDGAGTNMSDFSALLAGARDHDGSFFPLGYSTYILSSTESNVLNATNLNLLYYYGSTYVNYNYKYYGFSIRCIKD